MKKSINFSLTKVKPKVHQLNLWNCWDFSVVTQIETCELERLKVTAFIFIEYPSERKKVNKDGFSQFAKTVTTKKILSHWHKISVIFNIYYWGFAVAEFYSFAVEI